MLGTLYELLSSQVPGDCMPTLGFNMQEPGLLRLQRHMQQQPGVVPHVVKELFVPWDRQRGGTVVPLDTSAPCKVFW